VMGPPADAVIAYSRGKETLPAIAEALIVPTGKQKITLYWPDQTEVSPMVSGYVVFRRQACGDDAAGTARKQIAVLDKAICLFNDSNLTPGCTYYYAIYAMGNGPDDLGTAANEVAYRQEASLGAALSDIRLFNVEQGVLAQWSEPLDPDFRGITIYRSEKDNAPQKLIQLNKGNSQYLDKAVEKGKEYYYFFSTNSTATEGEKVGPVGIYRE